MLQRLTAAACLAVLAFGPGSAFAQADYPNRIIKFVAPFTAGSGSDAVARVVAQHAGPILGQTIIVENMPGANGMIGTQNVTRSQPDGYTVLLGSVTTHAANQSMMKKLSYKPVEDFKPVARLATVALALVVNPSIPVNNVRELIDYAKARPGELTFGSGSQSSRVAGELLKS